MMTSIKNKLKQNKLIVAIYMKLYGHKKEVRRVQIAKDTLRNEGFDYLVMIEDALTNAGARYFVNFGSLLGLLRSGEFISWDFDIDYGIYIDDSFSWEDLRKAMNGIGMTLARQFSFDGLVTEQTYKTEKLTIDFFAHSEDENNSYEYVYFKKKEYKYDSLDDAHVCRLKMYKFPGITKRKITNRDIDISVPVDAEKYLASIYREDWMIPNPNWISAEGPAWNELDNVIGHGEFF